MSDMTPAPREEWRAHHRGGEEASWIVGVILILLGGAFMLERSGVFVLTGNWWSVFIYLAAAASFLNMWRSYRARGEFGAGAGSSLTWGLVLTVIATIFLLNLTWDMWWPAILIAVGVGMVLSNWLAGSTRKPDAGAH
jgi:hypothetical protein